MEFFIELNPARDEYLNEDSSGLFIAGLCVIGLHHVRYSWRGWRFGLIVMNFCAGLWSGE